MHVSTIENQITRMVELGVYPDTDIAAASRTDAPVLFTGAPDAAEAVARQIHKSSGWRFGPFVVVDCSQPERELEAQLASLLAEAVREHEFTMPAARRSQDGVLFLREVGDLSPSAQANVSEWLAHLRATGRPGRRRRVMASSATPLIPQGLGGSFNDWLFYRLNLFHIQVEARQAAAPAN